MERLLDNRRACNWCNDSIRGWGTGGDRSTRGPCHFRGGRQERFDVDICVVCVRILDLVLREGLSRSFGNLESIESVSSLTKQYAGWLQTSSWPPNHKRTD